MTYGKVTYGKVTYKKVTYKKVTYKQSFKNFTHPVHYHATDFQHRHVCLLTFIAFPYNGTYTLQPRVRAVQPWCVALDKHEKYFLTFLKFTDHHSSFISFSLSLTHTHKRKQHV